MADPRTEAFAQTAKTIINQLERHGMEGYFCETSADAVELVRKLVPEGASIAWGGTATFAQTGVKAMLEAGIKRIHTMACPPNAARLHTGTPCERTGVCGNCHENGCMCCNIVVTRHNRHTGRIKVILIAEDLGY